MPEVGSVIGGRFRVDEILGAGGMGVVVAATHLELGHRVAIKFLHDGLAQNAQIVERFLREARAVVSLRTEHVCRVMDVSRLDSGAPYIVMEMLEGSDLQHVLANGALPLTIAVEYVMQACVALAEAHCAGIIHRDLKPANLFVTQRMDGGPLIKVLDFGIAKALAAADAVHLTSDSPMGSPGYMSPEQIQSPRDVDVRTDIWSLGVTLYQLLSARLPFEGKTLAAIAVRISTAPPDPLDVDPGLQAILWRCLAKDRAQRYPDIAELAHALVPFGGPAARGLAATTAQILYKNTSEPRPAPMPGPASAPASTNPPSAGMTDRPAVAPQVAVGYTSPPPGPSRRPLIVGVLVAVVGVAIGIGFAVRGGESITPQVAAIPKDAAVAVTPPPTSTVDAGEPVPQVDKTDKTVKQKVKPTEVKKRPASPKPKPPDPKPVDPNPADPKPAPAENPSTAHAVWEAACSKVSSRFAAVAPPGLITKCMCLKRDQTAAQQAYERISRDDREGPRTECAKLGIKLHE